MQSLLSVLNDINLDQMKNWMTPFPQPKPQPPITLTVYETSGLYHKIQAYWLDDDHKPADAAVIYLYLDFASISIIPRPHAARPPNSFL